MSKEQQSPKPPSEDGLTLIPFSCPDCGGVLSERRAGPKEVAFYVCQIKHRYSAGSLFDGKESVLEETLCAGITQSKQLALFYKGLLNEERLPFGVTQESILRRIEELSHQETDITKLLLNTHLLGSAT